MTARVTWVGRAPTHHFSKPRETAITLEAGHGVVGDAHHGVTVKHRSRVAKDPTQANLRQVHLIHEELFAELAGKGFAVRPGDLGENITTAGVDLLALPRGARLRIGKDALVEVTGLRNPCQQINRFQDGLMHAVLDRDANGGLIRKTGVMGIVLAGGSVRPDDRIEIELPQGEQRALEPV